jgi:competence ComEA-like helix-hairpin-helix protein
MNLTSTVRRSDQPVQIGSRHGYRIDGDVAYINAELSVPPYHPGGAWSLELWACEEPYQGGELSGVQVSEVQLELPTPIAPHTHRVEARAPAHLPLQGAAHTMLLALVERGPERRVHDVASYPELETFPAPRFEGEVGYEIRGHELVLQAAAVANPRSAGNLSGTLSIELWASPSDSEDAAQTARAHCLGAVQLAPLGAGQSVFGLSCRAAFSEPPAGQYQLELLLREWTQALGYLTRDRRAFDLRYFVPEDVAENLPENPAEDVAELQPVVVADAPGAPQAVIAPEALAPKAVPEAPLAKPVLPPPPAPKAAPVAAAPVVAAPVVSAPAAVVAVIDAPAARVTAPIVSAPAVVAAAVGAPAAVVAAVVAPRAVVAATSGRAARVSIQTASVEELARVKGLTMQVAKEIVKARPFTSLEDLVKVRGIGRKSLDKLRSLLSL